MIPAVRACISNKNYDFFNVVSLILRAPRILLRGLSHRTVGVDGDFYLVPLWPTLLDF